MFAVPFGRMLWKEYRVSRALWLSCLFIGILFQVIQSQMIVEPQSRVQLLLGGASFFSVMYAVGCGALLFACEREERTCDWLAAISIPPAPTLSAKFLFAIVSTIAMQFALALSSLIFLVGTPVQNLWELLLPVGVLVIVWSSLGSLLSRRVLTSVPAMAFWCLLPNAMLLFVLGNLRGQRINWDLQFWYYATILTVLMFAVDVWIGWEWCRGHYCDVALLQNLNIGPGFSWEKNALLKITKSRVPSRAERDQPWRRTWQRLVWQERHRESLHRYLVTIGCISGVALGISTLPGHGSVFFALFMFSVSALICLTPLSMGIFGFRADVQLQQPRFLSYRGISPAALWLAKQIVWLPRAFWVPGVVLFVATVSINLMEPSGRSAQLTHELVESMSNVFWFALLSYACGQLAAILFQRTVIAMAFGGLLTIVTALWLAVVNVLTLPQWWSLGLPVVAMLSITLWQMRPWLLEDHTWSRRWRLVSVLIAAPVMLVMILAFHRVSEVTTFHFADLVNSGQYEVNLLLGSASPSRTLSADEEFVRNRLQVLSQDSATDHRSVTDEIVALMKRDLVSLNRSNEENDFGYPYRLFNLMHQTANDDTEANELQKAFDGQLANLKLARITSSHGPIDQWMRGSTYQKSTLEAAVIWANHRSQTPVSIRNAIKAIEVELSRFPSATEGIAESYQHDRKTWILSSRAEFIEELTEHHIINSMESQWPLVATGLLPWERVRLDRLTLFNSQFNAFAIASLETMLSSPKGLTTRDFMRETTAQETWAASVDKTTFLASQIAVPLRSMMWTVLDRHTMVRAGLTRMELIAYRLEHGKVPDRLVELLPTIGGNNLVDPWSGRMFDYYPAFLMSAGVREIELLPITSTEFEFKFGRFGGNLARKPRLSIEQLTSDSEDTNTRIEELRKDAELVGNLFVIPPRPTAEPRAQ